MSSSVFPAGDDYFPSDGLLGTGFFEAGGFTPWNSVVFPTQEPSLSFSGSDDSAPKTNTSNSGSDYGDPNPQKVKPIDESKRRRMISNRESARRSRLRKQKHLENVRNQVNRLKTANRELVNRLRFLNHHGEVVREENEKLRSESVMLRQKLWDIHQILLVRQLHHQLLSSTYPCNNNNLSFINEQNSASLIT